MTTARMTDLLRPGFTRGSTVRLTAVRSKGRRSRSARPSAASSGGRSLRDAHTPEVARHPHRCRLDPDLHVDRDDVVLVDDHGVEIHLRDLRYLVDENADSHEQLLE